MWTQWSQCSKTQLKNFLSQGVGICLDNVPDTYMSAKCGNGIIDNGEECDCGLAPNAEVTLRHVSITVTYRIQKIPNKVKPYLNHAG